MQHSCLLLNLVHANKYSSVHATKSCACRHTQQCAFPYLCADAAMKHVDADRQDQISTESYQTARAQQRYDFLCHAMTASIGHLQHKLSIIQCTVLMYKVKY